MTILDPINAVLGALATILIIRDKNIGWYFNLATNFTGIMLYIQAGLYYFSFLKTLFFIMTIYGLKYSFSEANTKNKLNKICNILLISIICFMIFITSDPKLELPIISISLIAYYLTAFRYYNAFIYWSIYNILIIKMCIYTGLYWNLAKHLCYLIIGLWGLNNWHKQIIVKTKL